MPQARYIGNPATKEFHSIANSKPECNLPGDSNTQAKYKRFRTQKEAVEAGYDACGKRCVKKYKSRR
jgi:hypothetical protein